MTVAAVILAATTDAALADTQGQPRVRRLVDVAWSGGALPVVVVAPDPDGAVARALTGSEAIHEGPAPLEQGPVGQMTHGAERARAEVLDTTAVLIWPARMVWVGPETITSLIEAHGVDTTTLLRPAWRGEPGWPVLLPTTHLGELATLGPDAMPDAIIANLEERLPTRVMELGDPGATHDAATPLDRLPPYEGPSDPPAGHTHEWGQDVAAAAGLSEAD
jgi:CTP:molybdopterin cytidylyltransferase MocA